MHHMYDNNKKIPSPLMIFGESFPNTKAKTIINCTPSALLEHARKEYQRQELNSNDTIRKWNDAHEIN